MNEIKNNYVRFWIEEGILFNEFSAQVELNTQTVKELIELRHELSAGELQYWCYDFTKVMFMPKDGRDYAEKFGQEFLHASAAVISSKLQAFIINIFIMLKKPKVPFRAFIDKREAIVWLKDIKTKNEQLHA
jgi:hypothetical protein